MSTPVNDTVYQSPKHKLLAFFERSRNQWRARAKEYQQEKRVLQIHLRDVEASRDHWKQRAKRQEEELRSLRKELEASKTAIV